MSLPPGTPLGPYQIGAKLGEGGMGEVYRARDTTLNRDVAIKVLPEGFARDAERLARFTREAQVLASLNHPNIVQIHGIEHSPAEAGRSLIALVMELVDGEDLSAHIARGPIPLEEALSIARQIADALEAAHEQGIIHRDLKPQNIKLRTDGTVKVLDFGLAKALDPVAGGRDFSPAGSIDTANSPTITTPAMTIRGVILGTAAYMAPEQARGRVVDRRADIWAFGLVLYEMLTGRRGFQGEDISVTLANVIKEAPQWDALPADLPDSIWRLLRRCLEKDPKHRLSAIGDARLELNDATRLSTATAHNALRSGIGRRERLLWAAVTVVAAAAATAFALRSPQDREPTPPIARFNVLPPGEGRFVGSAPRLSISPDGRSLVFSATSQSRTDERFWLRRLDSTEMTPVPGTETMPGLAAPQSPFWSPDGRQLAFFFEIGLPTGGTGSRLRKVDLQGGAVLTVCELPSNNAGGSWNSDGVMLVSSQGTRGIQRVPANGGVPAPVTTLDPASNEIAHLFPQFLPDGRHFIYQVMTQDRDTWATYVGSIDSTDRRKVVESEYARFAAPNILLYMKNENLVAQIMDPRTNELRGLPVVVSTGVASVPGNRRAGFSVSDTGVLVYSSGPDRQDSTADRQLTWLDRNGRVLGTAGPPVSSFVVRLSPDGTRAALLERLAGQSTGRSLWLADLDRHVKAPLPPTRSAASPAWSADGSRLLFGSVADNGRVTMAERAASGATPSRSLFDTGGVPLDETTDGKLVVFASAEGSSPRRLKILSKADGRVTDYQSDEFNRPQASLSTDGKWLAYASNESGVYQVVVQPFPDPSKGKWQVSTSGGLAPRWRRDGRELYFVDSEQQLVAVPIDTTVGFEPGRATPLFRLFIAQTPNVGGSYVYDVAPDGQRFVVSISPDLAEGNSPVVPLTVMTNWTSLLKQGPPTP